MSEENVETLRQLLRAWNEGDLEGFLSFFHRDCEVIFLPQVPEPGPFHGRDELRGWAEGFLQAWDSADAELAEVVAQDERGLVAKARLAGRGTGSGLPMDLTWFALYEFQNGEIIRWCNFNERGEALEAARLSE